MAQDIDEVIKELLSDFELTDDKDEDLFYNVDEVNKENDGMANQWDKVDCITSDTGVEIGDKESDDLGDGLASSQGSDFDDVGTKKWYRQFNNKHDLKISVMFEVGDQFSDIYVFKRALKTYVVQMGFDYDYKHNDMSRISAVCKEEHCAWRIHASIDATKTCIQIKTYYLIYMVINTKTLDAMSTILFVLIRRTLIMIPHGHCMH